MNLVVRLAAFALLFFPSAAEAATTPTLTLQKVKAALPKLDMLVRQTQTKTGVPGIAVAVVFQDQVVYLKGFGVREVGKDQPVTADTVFQLASVSKPIGSTLLALLVALGIIDWDDRLIDRDPGFRLFHPWLTKEVTIRDMLCHRSGLPEHAGDLLEDMGYDRREILKRLRYLKPASSLRSKYAYTNFAFTEACVAGARATGKTWEDLIADKLYRPLGMKSASSRFADYIAANNRAVLHVRDKGKWVAKYVRKPDAQSPAGGVSSSARDLAKWLRLQLDGGKFDGKRLIAANALAETHRPQIISQAPKDPATDRAGFYGLGWNVSYDDQGRVRLGHSGAFDLGAATTVAMIPSEKLGILVLTNAAPIGVPEAISRSFFDLMLDGKVERDWLKLYGKLIESSLTVEAATDYSERPKPKSPPLPATSYHGVYANDYFGEIEFESKDGAMHLLMGPKKTSMPLKHWDRDIYTYQPVGEMATGLSGVIFRIGPDRRAMSVTIENLDVHGAGTFTRVVHKK